MKQAFLPILILAGGCTVAVTHPTKTDAEIAVDIDACTAQAHDRNSLDALAALYDAYDCLDAKGYQRTRPAMDAAIRRSLGQAPGREERPRAPCVVPCR